MVQDLSDDVLCKTIEVIYLQTKQMVSGSMQKTTKISPVISKEYTKKNIYISNLFNSDS